MRVGKQTVRAELAVNPGTVNLWGGGDARTEPKLCQRFRGNDSSKGYAGPR